HERRPENADSGDGAGICPYQTKVSSNYKGMSKSGWNEADSHCCLTNRPTMKSHRRKMSHR
ncbi:MAG TPA: hypothetical protein VIZ18_16470, partial [Ktedonobacteraceae bacterium]